MTTCLLNGELADGIGINDRGLHYGDGLFETIRIVAGQPRFWQGHMDRLATGCERLVLPVPPQALLLREVQTMAAGMPECVVKIILTRGYSERGYVAPETPDTSRIVIAYPWTPPEQPDQYQGVHTRICNLRLAMQPKLAGIKHLNRLEQVIAATEIRKFVQQPEISEGILLDTRDHVISATTGNLFLVGGGSILTPRLDYCGVRGVVRAEIIRAFKSRCELRRVTLDMLPEANEVFITNSVRGVIPVRSIDNWEFEIGPVTREIQQWLLAQ
jgi:4-amino-4-deoxychorismate lyase